MKRTILACFCICLVFNDFVFASAEETDRPESGIGGKLNYIGITPTFALMGMYGISYARALNESLLLTGVFGYTNFDWSPIPFLHNENWLYQNVYGGANITYFPFSKRLFPEGLYFGFDLVPSLGFWTNRFSADSGNGLDLSFDVLSGYSWIVFDFLKISIDVFLNFNPPGVLLSGTNWNTENRWTILPFFDVNIGIVF
jgi:hypothetical protein